MHINMMQHTHTSIRHVHPLSSPDRQLLHVYAFILSPSSPTHFSTRLNLFTFARSPPDWYSVSLFFFPPLFSHYSNYVSFSLPFLFCYIDILSLPLYCDSPLTAPQVTLSMTTDLRGKCEVPPHQEIKTLASFRCLTPLTSLSPNPHCITSCSVSFFFCLPTYLWTMLSIF